MLGLFNRKSAWKLGLQGANLVALLVATYDLYQNPDKLAQNGFDMAVHALTLLSLRENVGAIEAFLATNLNSGQIAVLGVGAASGCANLANPLVAVIADVTLHTLSGVSVIFSSDEEENKSTELKMS